MRVQATPIDHVRSWEAYIRGMERDWNEISVRQTKVLLDDWHEAMSEMQRQYNCLVSAGRWVTGPSDFLNIIGRARDENTHSRMLAWLLNPTGRHGLGFGLVKRLVEHCTGKPMLAPVAVRRVAFSQWRKGREADIVVWGQNFTLVIENKVDAPEGSNQCDDLYKHFKDENMPLFLFLTKDGRCPRTASTPHSKCAFRTLSWPKVRAMLEEAFDESQSETGVASAVDVVRNYLLTLKEQFG